MALCTNCGHELSDGSKFCNKCGTPIGKQKRTERQSTYEGKLHKCSNCGELLEAFTIRCPSCGFEVRDSKTAGALRELTDKLEVLEANRKWKNNTDGQMMNLIRNFSIPNTKEDIYEFMILASSNIDVRNTSNGISGAWLAKFEQAYEKAKISFGYTSDFDNIQRIYRQKTEEIRAARVEISVAREKKEAEGRKAAIIAVLIPCAFLFIAVLLTLGGD